MNQKQSVPQTEDTAEAQKKVVERAGLICINEGSCVGL